MMYGYKTNPRSTVEIVDEDRELADEGDRYSTTTSWTAPTRITRSDTFPDVVVPFECEKGKTYYLVYVIWSTGDSFSNDENAEFDELGMFETREEARALVNRVNEDYNSDSKVWNRHYTDSAGNVHTYFESWKGYFESLTVCDYAEVTLR